MLAALLDEMFSLTHLTGYRQPTREWMAAIDSGEMRYHAAAEESVAISVTDSTATLIGRSVVSATIYGMHSPWRLQLTIDYARRNETWVPMKAIATTF